MAWLIAGPKGHNTRVDTSKKIEVGLFLIRSFFLDHETGETYHKYNGKIKEFLNYSVTRGRFSPIGVGSRFYRGLFMGD